MDMYRADSTLTETLGFSLVRFKELSLKSAMVRLFSSGDKQHKAPQSVMWDQSQEQER